MRAARRRIAVAPWVALATSSCTALFPFHPSQDGWTQVAQVDASFECPPPWVHDVVGSLNVAVCRRATADDRSVSVASFTPPFEQFRQVKGTVVGIQQGSTDGFGTYNPDSSSHYVDGVTITLEGTRPAHVWTYAAAWSDDDNDEESACPCVDPSAQKPPDFVGEHYSCESGTTGRPDSALWYDRDWLWVGEGTPSDCSSGSAGTTFVRTWERDLSERLDVAIRLDQGSENEDVGIVSLELWVR